MNPELIQFAERLRPALRQSPQEIQFGRLALGLFSLQFQSNPVYQKICESQGVTPQQVGHWKQIPVVPTSLFKELELTSIPIASRTAVFHSSGTTEQKPSRHFHCVESMAVYEASLVSWFFPNVLPEFQGGGEQPNHPKPMLVFLSPPPEQVPHSSLVHMFETVGKEWNKSTMSSNQAAFLGKLDKDGSWTLDFVAVTKTLLAVNGNANIAPLVLLGTAFSFVHLMDHLAEQNLRLTLPVGSRVMETGGYKNRSRSMPKTELHALISGRLGVPPENIICEYGMSELSSQAYDSGSSSKSASVGSRVFRFPPWARVQIVSPETGAEVAEGETGLIRIFDLANVFSVSAIQTEDLGIRRADGFELLGRSRLAEPRGCSLTSAENQSPRPKCR